MTNEHIFNCNINFYLDFIVNTYLVVFSILKTIHKAILMLRLRQKSSPKIVIC